MTTGVSMAETRVELAEIRADLGAALARVNALVKRLKRQARAAYRDDVYTAERFGAESLAEDARQIRGMVSGLRCGSWQSMAAFTMKGREEQ